MKKAEKGLSISKILDGWEKIELKNTLKVLQALEKRLDKEAAKFEKMKAKASKLLQRAIDDVEDGKLSKGLEDGSLVRAVADLMFDTGEEIYALEDAVGEDLEGDDEEDEEEDGDTEEE